MRRPLILLTVAAVALAGCGSDDDSTDTQTATAPASADTGGSEAAGDSGAGVVAEGAWARMSAMGQTLGAAYMTLTATVDDRLVAVSVPAEVASGAEIHEVVPVEVSGMETGEMPGMETGEMSGMGSGEMSMRELEGGLALPGGETVTLQPGGYHIMLIDLAAPLEVGDVIQLTLDFEHAESITLDVEVAESAP